MEVVSMLNAMYSIFDQLTELNGVYKVFLFLFFFLSFDVGGCVCYLLQTDLTNR